MVSWAGRLFKYLNSNPELAPGRAANDDWSPRAAPCAGTLLPAIDIPVTTSLVTCGSLATLDFEKVHHDKAFAQASGMPDVYMNILTTQGLVEAYLRDWCGPDAVVFRKLAIRLGAPNIPAPR